MSAIIEARNVSKKFLRRTSGGSRYKTLRDTLTNGVLALNPTRKSPTASGAPSKEEFWALKDINFSLNEGEVVGIIGRNGAGKSTLLKILSQITTPTEGEIRMYGRVGSLLEVGTGFHPELSGRENVYMNGAILGMGREEIKRKFDEIVEFSGVEQFIDTPVKRYSSGMHMRLAFAVAAHLDPEIMIVDEVLAVGDADFQKKCLGKMKNVSKSGRTVLFVSHNMNAIQQLCSRVIWIDKGHLKKDSSDINRIAADYLFGQDETALKSEWSAEHEAPFETEYFKISRFRITTEDGNTLTTSISNNVPLIVEIEVELKKHHPALNFGYAIINEEGHTVYWTATTDRAEENWPALMPGKNVLRSLIPCRLLNEGVYRFDLLSSLHAQGWFSEPGNTPYSISLNISGDLSDSPYWRAIRPGIVAPVLDWERK